MDQKDNKQIKQPSSYGKKPIWFWILIYLVAAIIVYGIIYLVFFHHSHTSSSSWSY